MMRSAFPVSLVLVLMVNGWMVMDCCHGQPILTPSASSSSSSLSSASDVEGLLPSERKKALIPFPRVGRALIPFPRMGRGRAVFMGNGDSFPAANFMPLSYYHTDSNDVQELKRNLIPFPRIGKRQSLIPFPRIGRSGPPPAQSDAAELYDDAQDGIGQQEDDNAQQVYYFPSRWFNVATGPKVSANDY